MTPLGEASARREFVVNRFRCCSEEDFLGWWEMALKATGPVNGKRFCKDCVARKLMAEDGLCVREDKKEKVA